MGFLLDVNVLVALMWPSHDDHKKVQHWFRGNSEKGWATCNVTQAGFVRVVSNPAFSSDAVSPTEALNLLRNNVMHAHHQFWPGDITFLKAVEPFSKKLVGHRQVTDAYLLGLALHKHGKLVSLDRGILQLISERGMERDLLALL